MTDILERQQLLVLSRAGGLCGGVCGPDDGEELLKSPLLLSPVDVSVLWHHTTYSSMME